MTICEACVSVRPHSAILSATMAVVMLTVDIVVSCGLVCEMTKQTWSKCFHSKHGICWSTISLTWNVTLWRMRAYMQYLTLVETYFSVDVEVKQHSRLTVMCACVCLCNRSLTAEIRCNVVEMGQLLGKVPSSGATRFQSSQRSAICKDSDSVIKPLIESLENKWDRCSW